MADIRESESRALTFDMSVLAYIFETFDALANNNKHVLISYLFILLILLTLYNDLCKSFETVFRLIAEGKDFRWGREMKYRKESYLRRWE